MEQLLETLTQYAEETLILRFLRENTPKIRAAEIRAEKLEEKLRALSSEAGELLEQFQTELGMVQFCREQAFLLSGISIGLKLGRL